MQCAHSGSRSQGHRGEYGADAKVVLKRGCILTNADTEPVEGDTFGPQSYHNGDYALFFNNIKDNVAKRVAAYSGVWRRCDQVDYRIN